MTYRIVSSFSLLVPLASFVVTETASHFTSGEKFRPLSLLVDVLASQGLVMLGATMDLILIELVKLSYPIPRPFFLDVCRPDFATLDCSVGYVQDYTCLNTTLSAQLKHEMESSFPSGHTATAAFSATVMAYYYEKRWTVAWSMTLKIVLQSILVCWTVFVGLSRVTDRWHHPTDIIFGYIIGIAVGLWMIWTLGRHMETFSGKRRERYSTENSEENGRELIPKSLMNKDNEN